MKYSILNQIEALDFNVSSGELNYVNVHKDLIFRNEIMSNDITVAGYFLDNRFFFFCENLDTLILDVNTEQIFNIGLVSPHYETLSNNKVVCNEYKDCISFERKLVELNLQDFSKRNILDSFEYGLKLKIGNEIICSSSHATLKSINLETGTYLWEVDLGKYSTAQEAVNIREILGIWEDNLVVLMNNNDTLVLISFSTGQIVAEICHIHAYCGGVWSFGWYFHLEGGYVYLLQQNSYIRINLSTQTIETLWVHENTRYTIQRVSYDEQYAYFMGGNDNSIQPDLMGVFDRKELKIVWQYDHPIYSSQPPQSDGNKLYCLDTAGTLHIFEREE
jgi:hypothetical protein